MRTYDRHLNQQEIQFDIRAEQISWMDDIFDGCFGNNYDYSDDDILADFYNMPNDFFDCIYEESLPEPIITLTEADLYDGLCMCDYCIAWRGERDGY